MHLHGIDQEIWPVHPPPLPDELLSSWMVRLACLNGHKVKPFYELHLNRGREIWPLDIDKFAPLWLLEGLTKWTGVSPETIHSTTLRSFEGYLFDHFTLSGNAKWILSLPPFGSKNHHHGMQYCPQCLAEDNEPYFRRTWRCALVTVCLKHGLMLRDRCYSCGLPVVALQSEVKARLANGNPDFRQCYHCGGSLTDQTAYMKAIWPTTYHEELTQKWIGGLSRSWLNTSPLEKVWSPRAYKELHDLCTILLEIEQLGEFYNHPSKIEKPPNHRVIEEQNVTVRHSLVMTGTFWLSTQLN